MILRLLFVVLCALNIVVAAWLWLGQPYAPTPPPRSDPGVATLQLLSEGPAAATTVVEPAPTASVAVPAAAASAVAAIRPATLEPVSRCFALGPFATPQDLRGVRVALAPQATRTRARQELATQTGSWWVYLPAARSRAAALANARRLADRKISDYFVVGDGDQANSISLGVFNDPANARRRRDDVVAAGFNAQMAQRTQTVPEYWLDVVLRPGAPHALQGVHLAAGVQQHGAACF